MERRDLLQLVMSTGALATLQQLSLDDVAAFGEQVHRAAAPLANTTDRQRVWAALTAAQARTVQVMAEDIIPRTSTPGATDANVTAFIDRMLADWYAPAERDVVLQGLPQLDIRALAERGTSYVALPAARRAALLEALDGEVTALRRTNGAAANAHWFSTLKYLTVFGYCTSEPGMSKHLDAWPLTGRYDGNAPVRS
jgi:gluconate 2-dehydrogenase gamma chain